MAKIPSESGSAYRADISAHTIRFAAARGPKADDLMRMDLTIPVGTGLVGVTVEEGVGIALSDVQRDPRFFRAISEKLGYQTRSVITVPVQLEGQVMGALQLINRTAGLDLRPGRPEHPRLPRPRGRRSTCAAPVRSPPRGVWRGRRRPGAPVDTRRAEDPLGTPRNASRWDTLGDVGADCPNGIRCDAFDGSPPPAARARPAHRGDQTSPWRDTFPSAASFSRCARTLRSAKG